MEGYKKKTHLVLPSLDPMVKWEYLHHPDNEHAIIFPNIDATIHILETGGIVTRGNERVALSLQVRMALLRALQGHWHFRRSLILPWSQLPFPRPIPEHLFAEIVEFL